MFFYEPLIGIIIITILSLIIKKILFSANFIQERLEFFANALKTSPQPSPKEKEEEIEKQEEILNLADIKQEEVEFDKQIETNQQKNYSDSIDFVYSNLETEKNIYEKTEKIDSQDFLEKQEDIETNSYEYEEKNYEPSAIQIFFDKL
jgi:hypothetical protein